MKNLTVADFFCGAGGWSEGFRQEGFDVVFALDYWRPAVDTHHLNHPNCSTVRCNILDLDSPKKIDELVPDVDVIVGSPPCVLFSSSNNAGKSDKTKGIELIKSFLRVIAWKKSKGQLKYWIMENVPNSRHHIQDLYTWKELGLPGRGPDLRVVRRDILTASDYGVPQVRQRFVCGDYPAPEKTSNETNWITIKAVKSALGDPLEAPSRKIRDPLYGIELSTNLLTDHYYDTRIANFQWKQARRLKEDHGYMGKMSFPENDDRPSRTIMATRSASAREAIIYKARTGYRLPTIREIATCMSFPITYQFEAANEPNKYRLVGNAVCVKMSVALAKAIRVSLNLKAPNNIEFPTRRPSFDLTGTAISLKKASPRRSDARFKMHVPNLKLKSMRVELTNEFSDFKTQRYRWAAALHFGAGCDATWMAPSTKQLIIALQDSVDFDKFRRLVSKSLSSLPSAEKLQQLFVARSSDDNSPENLLRKVFALLNSFENNLENCTIELNGKRIPIKIAFALYAVQFICESLDANHIPKPVNQVVPLHEARALLSIAA